MGSAKRNYKKDDENDDYDDVQVELSDENEIVIANNTDLEDALEPSSDNTNSDSDGNSDYLYESDEQDTNSDIEKESVESLTIGRETENLDDDILQLAKICNTGKEHQPPTLTTDFMVTCVSFSPSKDILAVGNMEGDICLYSYSVEKTELILKYSAHMGSCRHIEYDDYGELIYSISDDKCVIVADVESGKFRNSFDEAHEYPIYSLMVMNNNLFFTGDDEGVVKLWDRRKKNEVFSVKVSADYVSSLKCLDEGSTLICTTGDGILSAINTNTRRIFSTSEPYEAELTCSELFCSNTKLAVGTSKGSLLLYSWGQFSSWNDEFPGLDNEKHAINCMIPVTENIVVTGLDNGFIRATNLFPMRHVGIVGQHNSTVEGIDINRDGTLLASNSIDKEIHFWNIEYFEDLIITDKMITNNSKARENNLPSSQGVNADTFFSGLK